MLTFTRTIFENIMNLWLELLGIMEEITLNDEPDQINWSFISDGKFSIQFLYAVINDHGVKPVYIHDVWKLSIPPTVQIFLWLLCKNKLLTRDNLSKRTNVEDKTCLFYAEPKSINHLLFECCVAKVLSSFLSVCLELNCSWSYESVASLWIANK